MRQRRGAGRGRARRGTLTRFATAAVVVAGLTAGCSGASDETEPEPSPTTTPLAEVDLTGVVASRTEFCDALDPDSVATALGGEPETTESYSSGQQAEMAPGLDDVAHEFSCSFVRGSNMARAWLFAQPATAKEARGWIQERIADKACRTAGELGFGDPGLVQLCDDPSQRRVTAVGLFGDGYLTCKVTGPPKSDEDDLLERAQRWCAEVAQSTTT
jgi:hypothetical protein